jgi:adenosylcobinamide-GDP ribazoletransferase
MNPVSEARLLVCATQFLTRLPTPQLKTFQPEWIGRSTRYFPLVGQLVGLISALVWLGAGRLWGGTVAAILAIGAGALVTGGFHEDGLADTADGLGGGSTPARRLEIMKDSRIGTYGALALGLVTALRVAALASASPMRGALALLAAHGAGRAVAVVAMATQPYVGEATSAKAGASPQRASGFNAVVAVLIALWPFALFDWRAGGLGLGIGVVLAAGVMALARRLIGGRTGDVLGAVEQVVEVGVLLGVACVYP